MTDKEIGYLVVGWILGVLYMYAIYLLFDFLNNRKKKKSPANAPSHSPIDKVGDSRADKDGEAEAEHEVGGQQTEYKCEWCESDNPNHNCTKRLLK